MSLLEHPRFREAAELHKAGRFDEAGKIYQELIEENPNDPDLWHFKGLLSAHKGDFEEAIRYISLAIMLKPGVPDYFQNLAFSYEAAGNTIKAAETYNKLGNALQEQCRFADTMAPYTRALELKPDFTSVLINRGSAFDRLGRYLEAAADFTLALERLGQPDDPAGLLNVANALSGLGRSQQAIEIYTRMLEIEPRNVSAHCSRALLRLRLGDMAEGWKEYEWRWNRDGGFREPRGQFRQPVWHGETPQELGGTLLVIAEQGLGDIIQFARYVPLLAAQGHDILFETLPELTTLFAEGFDHPNIRVIPRIDAPLEVEGNLPFAAWVGVMSLPERFATTLATVPNDVPYVKVAPKKAAQWQSRLTGDGLKIGLVWAGNPKNLNDFARSIPAQMLGPLLDTPDVTFYSLQKGPSADHESGRGNLVKLGPELTDFTQTAAAILALDLVITVDTSVCHLAGALGKPVWLMIPMMPDWRWLNEGEATVWYPTMRIFRQSVRGQWGDVIQVVAEALLRDR